jgi:hypothetical protein
LLAGIAVGLAVAALWLWWKTGSAANRLDSPEAVTRMLKYLMSNGVDQAELRFQLRGAKEKSLLFKKYFRTDQGAAIRSVFEKRATTATAFENLKNELDQRGVPYRITVNERKQCFLMIDYGADLQLATTVVGIILEVFFAPIYQPKGSHTSSTW